MTRPSKICFSRAGFLGADDVNTVALELQCVYSQFSNIRMLLSYFATTKFPGDAAVLLMVPSTLLFSDPELLASSLSLTAPPPNCNFNLAVLLTLHPVDEPVLFSARWWPVELELHGSKKAECFGFAVGIREDLGGTILLASRNKTGLEKIGGDRLTRKTAV